MNHSYLRPAHLFSILLSLGVLLFELPRFTGALCGGIVLVYLFLNWQKRMLYSKWIPQLAALASGGFFFWVYGTLLSPESASSLMSVQMCLKLFELKTHRDTMMFLIMNLLLSMFYVLFNQTLFSTVIIFINYFFFIFFLLDLQKQKLGLKKDPFSLKQLISLETIVALPLLISLFIFFPRFTPSWSGLGAAATDQVTGFSNHLSPGEMQNLAQSDLVAFRFIPANKKIPPPEELYFRGTVLTENEGWTWKVAKQSKVFIPEQSSQSADYDYEIILEPRFERTLFTLEPTEHIEVSPEAALMISQTDKTTELRLPAESKMKIKGWLRSNSSKERFENTKVELGELRSPSSKINNLISPLLSLTPSEKLKALLDFYQNGKFQYSTETPAYATLDDFLFGKKIGFCEHFASSFGTLAKLVSLPVRVIIGFQGAEVNTYGSFLVVRDKNAHAWNEVYLPEQGWVRVDVTAIVSPSRILQGSLINSETGLGEKSQLNFLKNFLMAFDAINNKFNLLLMNYNGVGQQALLENWGLASLGLKSIVKIFAFLVLGFSILFWWLSQRGRERLDLLGRGYQLLTEKTAKRLVPRSENEGPFEFMSKIKASHLNPDVVSLIERYTVLRYGKATDSKEILSFYKDVKKIKV